MIVNNTWEVIESDEYGKAVFHAVDVNMDDQDFSMMDEIIYASWKKITSQNTLVIKVNTMSNTWSLKNTATDSTGRS